MGTKKTDNRMEWIRCLEGLGDEQYVQGFEVLSECYISGGLNYGDGRILCQKSCVEKSSDGLYSYLIRVKFPIECLNSYRKPTRKGYGFNDGIAGELMALFSLKFRCRFYYSASIFYQGDDMWPIKNSYNYSRIECDPKIHEDIFSSIKCNFAKDIPEFFDNVKMLPEKFHRQFILACHHYLLALREVGMNTEMVFIRLVSAVEALSSSFLKLEEKDDLTNDSDFKECIKFLNLSEKEEKEYEMIFKTKKSTEKFKRFIEIYSDDYVEEKDFLQDNGRHIKRDDLIKVVETIYSARSRYLHSGEPMYLSRPMRTVVDGDFDLSCGCMIDNRMLSVKNKLPYASWFEGLVRHCLLNFLKEKVKDLI